MSELAAMPPGPEALRRRRQALGLSQEQLARRLGVSFATVNRWERGRTRPRGAALAGLAAVQALVPLPAVPARGDAPVLRRLPRPSGSFVGRDEDVTLIVDAMRRQRLVTIVGPAGIGKTRLAVEAIAQGRIADLDGAAFVDLGPVDAGEVAQAVAVGLGADAGSGDVVAALVASTGGRRHLLVLDNCEHVLEACRDLVARLVRAAPGLTIVATSREAIGAAGEAVLRIEPLGTDGAESVAMRLFIDRVAERLAGYRPKPDELAAIGTLCRRLDGLPLAIELAAGCVPRVSVGELLDGLDRRFDLLVADAEPSPGRQRGLGAAIAWSYDLLAERERVLLDRLSVVPGSFSLELAEAVGTHDGGSARAGAGAVAVADTGVLLSLAALAGKSLVETRTHDDQVRYVLLESVRAFAAERLRARGGTDAASRALFDWTLGWAERLERGLAGREQAAWLARGRLEAGSIAAAIEWAIGRGDAARAVELAGLCWRFWYSSGDVGRGLGWLSAALALPGSVARPARAKALFGAGVIARHAGRLQASIGFLREHLQLAEAAGDEHAVAEALNSLAGAMHASGDDARARELLRRSLDRWERSGDRRGLATALSNLGVLASDGGDQAWALEYGEQALAIRLALGLDEDIAISYENLGTASMRAGRTIEARRYHAEALRRYAALGEPDGVASTLEGLAAMSPDAIGARLLGAAEQLREQVGVPRSAGAQADVEAARRRILEGIGEEVFAREEPAGRRLSIDDAVAIAGAQEAAGRLDAGYEQSLRRRLTPREREVLALASRGQTTKEIAGELRLSPRTIERHLSNLYAKIGARGRADAIAYAVRTELADR